MQEEIMKKGIILLSVVIITILSGCVSEVQKENPDLIEWNIPSLYKEYSKYFEIGAAIEPYQFQDSLAERELLLKHFSSITAENVMKQMSIQPVEGLWSFTQSDYLVDFAEENGKVIRGHCLVWHHPDQTAFWMLEDNSGNIASREIISERLETHIKTLVGRYKGKIYAWDVINEPIDIETGDSLRHTVWYENIGPEYMELALQWAHEADPDALLFINEYDTFEPRKCTALYNLVKSLLDKGVPVHGVGIQLHMSIGYPELSQVEDTITKLEQLGLEIHVTELDMSLYASEYEVLETAPESYLIHQAYRYKELFEIFKRHPAVTNVTFWGFNDSHTWLLHFPTERPNWPLIFDADMMAKPAYWALVDPSVLPPDEELEMEVAKARTYKAPYGTPVIDGEIDDIWESAPVIVTDKFVMQNEGATAEVRALWDEDHLYVLAEVTDPILSDISGNAYEEDSFEVFVDENNGKTTSYETDDFQYRVNFLNKKSVARNTKMEYYDTAAAVTDSGYIVEIVINFQTIKGSQGSVLGFDLQVNDDFGDGARSSIAKWNDPTNESWRNTSGLGILELVK
jgi:endo-1,4-beta-xylanase